jgi:EAL domain-containing protein (putative c-di-GMP-specific phosphodiesterase class I)
MGMAKPAAPLTTDWSTALASACAGAGLRAVYQPVVDLQRGVIAGYEALIRFGGPRVIGPGHWFAAAREHGCEAELEVAALATTLVARHDLPPDTFLSVNVSPTALATAPVAELLDEQLDLRGLVLELTEQSPVEDHGALAAHLDHYRSRGALVAIDDAGSGYAGLSRLLELRPSILKLDRILVSDIDQDEAKRILVEMLGLYAGRLDAWIAAEGIETMAELQTLRALGVPLGQGWALGRPAQPWASLDDHARGTLRHAPEPAVDRGCKVAVLLERVDTVAVADRERTITAMVGGPADAFVVVVDEHAKPVRAVTPGGAKLGRTGPVLAVSLSTLVTDVAGRALTRPPEHRFEPVVCTDPAGRAVGIVRIERIIEALARAAACRA